MYAGLNVRQLQRKTWNNYGIGLITEAARLAGKSRSTLYKTYIETGKLSVGQDSATGRPVVDTSELIRVFGALYLTN